MFSNDFGLTQHPPRHRDGVFVPLALPSRDLIAAADDMRRDLNELGAPRPPWNMLGCVPRNTEIDRGGDNE
jgi:hypothetical protein